MKTKSFLFYAAIGVAGYFFARKIIKHSKVKPSNKGKLSPETLKKLYASVEL